LHADVAGHLGHNDWKAGADAILRHVHEQLAYGITDPGYFDPGTQQQLQFAQQLWDSEPAAFAEDTLHVGHWNIAAGLRYDDYSFVVQRSAWSPRLAISRYFPSAHLVVHASYDRIFQVPAIENLMLASSPAFDSVSDFVQRLPVQPAYAHYYEFGFTEAILSKLRITGNVYLRTFRDYADDDTLLNTGVSFPISDASARIKGEEVSVYMPERHHVMVQVSYSNQTGTASGPITGGLFIGDEGANELATTGRFPISQDQRNTLRAQARWSPLPRLWFDLHAQGNSGLPVELDDVDLASLRAAYGSQIVDAVNFSAGRVRPWSSVDVASGAELLSRGDHQLTLEFHTANLANRVNVINFASLFSGTAVAPPRSYDARLRFEF
jgi:outer membrane receptor for Fe3+-dicitrate